MKAQYIGNISQNWNSQVIELERDAKDLRHRE